MNQNQLMLYAGVGIAGIILLTKGKVGNYIGQSAGIATGTALTGAVTGIVEGVTINPYKWAQQQEYIPIVDDITKPIAETYVWLRNLGNDQYLFW